MNCKVMTVTKSTSKNHIVKIFLKYPQDEVIGI